MLSELALDHDHRVLTFGAQHRGKLHEEMSGASWEVFGKTLRGLSGAKLTRPSQFRSQDDAYAVRCSYKVGILTPRPQPCQGCILRLRIHTGVEVQHFNWLGFILWRFGSN